MGGEGGTLKRLNTPCPLCNSEPNAALRHIIIEQHYPDLFSAVDDATYDGPVSAMGVGRTPQEAVKSLFEQEEG
jgi:hypothetical protein